MHTECQREGDLTPAQVRAWGRKVGYTLAASMLAVQQRRSLEYHKSSSGSRLMDSVAEEVVGDTAR